MGDKEEIVFEEEKLYQCTDHFVFLYPDKAALERVGCEEVRETAFATPAKYKDEIENDCQFWSVVASCSPGAVQYIKPKEIFMVIKKICSNTPSAYLWEKPLEEQSLYVLCGEKSGWIKIYQRRYQDRSEPLPVYREAVKNDG